MVAAQNRQQALLSSTEFNGIDFVEIGNYDQTILRVHFLNKVEIQGTLENAIAPDGKFIPAIAITGGETIPTVSVINQGWEQDGQGRPILILTVAGPGDFSVYTLSLNSPRLDRFFAQVTFSFKALCESNLDCATPPPPCPLTEAQTPAIDYLAKDFLSFRQALSDFSKVRYPEWQERSEADFGVMFMEALCALADDLSYTQDRIAAEATLDTATQRRSLLRHSRLVDYEPRPATSAHVLLQLDVTGGSLPSGLIISTQTPEGLTIYFETGTGLINPQTGKLNNTTYQVDPRWNRHNLSDSKPYDGIKPYYWDDSLRCLKAGTTEMWVENVNQQPFDFPDYQDLLLLIDTQGATSADPPIREVVRLVTAKTDFDPLFNQYLTHLVWRKEDALKYDHDLTKTIVVGNLVPATQGRRYTEQFAIDEAPNPQTPLAIARTGANNTIQYLYTLRNNSLVWLTPNNSESSPIPEIFLQSDQNSEPWIWRRSLLQAAEFESAYTIEPVSFRPIARTSQGDFVQDYDGDNGNTIRFGDGIFGQIPEPETVFKVTYRVGVGVLGNVAADSITSIDSTAAGVISAVTNPFPAWGGADAETDEQVRRLAPQAFRTQQFRAVRREDYEAAANSLSWVQRAGTAFRWTGSWLTVFTTPDPKNSETLQTEQQIELINLLNRYRLAGYESYVNKPRYVSLDLIVKVCARVDAFAGDVEAALLAALSANRFLDGTTGFFHVDRFTFGMPLERSVLEAVMQNISGVAGVVKIEYRQRGVTVAYLDLPETLHIPVDSILRVDNNPNQPEYGSLQVIVEGGK